VLVVTAIVAVLVIVAGFTVWRWVTPPALSANASPETVARTYFQLDAAGRFWAAKHLVSRSGRPDIPDGRGYGGSRIIRVGKASPDSKAAYGAWYDAFTQICVVTIDYRRTRADDAGDPPGDYSVAVDLGRKTPHGPWRVLYVGSLI